MNRYRITADDEGINLRVVYWDGSEDTYAVSGRELVEELAFAEQLYEEKAEEAEKWN